MSHVVSYGAGEEGQHVLEVEEVAGAAPEDRHVAELEDVQGVTPVVVWIGSLVLRRHGLDPGAQYGDVDAVAVDKVVVGNEAVDDQPHVRLQTSRAASAPEARVLEDIREVPLACASLEALALVDAVRVGLDISDVNAHSWQDLRKVPLRALEELVHGAHRSPSVAAEVVDGSHEVGVAADADDLLLPALIEEAQELAVGADVFLLALLAALLTGLLAGCRTGRALGGFVLHSRLVSGAALKLIPALGSFALRGRIEPGAALELILAAAAAGHVPVRMAANSVAHQRCDSQPTQGRSALDRPAAVLLRLS
mmetsp:Transcript_102841/g.300013  ORF Transcript_102841/g.300013 Transcript_102841/m.300013 type:complete len:310 (-) Transcript_102841:58-987(-)